jgi:hypothetical protein
MHNKAAFEGCITEGYIAECYIAIKLVTFNLAYLDEASTFHNRSQRNLDGCEGASTRVILN